MATSGGPRASDLADGGRPQTITSAVSFEDFFQAQAPALFRRMCLVTGDRHEAEEVVQDAFLAVFERWERIQGLDDPVGYLYRTAFNRWRKLSRRAGRQVREMVGMAKHIDEFGEADNRAVIDRALAELTPRQRAAVVLTDLLGYSSAEAGEMLGVRDVTVRALSSQGRATLRRVLGGTP